MEGHIHNFNTAALKLQYTVLENQVLESNGVQVHRVGLCIGKNCYRVICIPRGASNPGHSIHPFKRH